MESVIVHVPPCDRMAFLAERRALSVQRFDTVHSPHYDRHWGAISATHADFAARPALLAAGLRVLGTDQSAGMLGQAGRKHPEVAVRVLALQDLAATADLAGRFDGLLCVDALECVAPEHWPGVAAGLAATVRTGAPAYVTVELWTGPLPAVTDPRQVPGEVIEDGGYHYYPSRPQVRQWLDTAGFTVAGQADDDYWHLLLTRH